WGLTLPARISWTASPDPIARASIRMSFPLFVFGPVAAKAFACSSSQLFFSLPYANTTVIVAGGGCALEGACAGGESDCLHATIEQTATRGGAMARSVGISGALLASFNLKHPLAGSTSAPSRHR